MHRSIEENTKLRCWRMNPTGNITLLAEGDGLPENAPFAAIADRLMQEEPGAEQAGFVFFRDPAAAAAGADLRLRMAGGEFCGNAALSAAALFLHETGRPAGSVRVLVSGEPVPVEVRMEAVDGRTWKGRIRMPAPIGIESVLLPAGGSGEPMRPFPVVRFRGIAHVIIDRDAPGPETGEASRIAPLWCGLLRADAVGMLFLDSENGRMDPLVYVPAADTLFWESSCASGTAAVGAWLFSQTGKPVSAALAQPCGSLCVEADKDGILLCGQVILEHCHVA